ncbi:MAG: ABC transporter ATP-binding protein [Solimonas sp.]
MIPTRDAVPAQVPASATPVVVVDQLVRRFGSRAVLDRLDLRLAPGEFVALLGRSGSGKTTLLRTLAGIDPVQEGRVQVPDARAVVFQEPRLMPWQRAWRNVTLGLRSAGRERALAALVEVGLEHRVDAWPSALSGGEAQRVALARALVREPQFMLLDEPFAALDALTRIRMHALILALWQAHRPAVLLVTHDIDEALLLADRVLVLADGRIETELHVDLPRPRDNSQRAFQRMRLDLLRRLGVDGAPIPAGPDETTPRPPARRDDPYAVENLRWVL